MNEIISEEANLATGQLAEFSGDGSAGKWIEKESRWILPTYRRWPVVFIRGEGMRLWDAEGREYLDFVSGLGVTGLGHAHPRVAAAVAEQAGKLVHTSNLYYTEPQIRLAEALSSRTLGGKCFFANSGAEANEAAIKLARRHGQLHLGGAYRIICAESSFHGRTLATLAATGQPEKHEPFRPLPEGFVHVPWNDPAALAGAAGEETCAVLLEPIQGEGGVRPADQAYLAGARELCDRKNLLLIFDEVQTGMGRTGQLFAYQGYGVTPDALTVAKALANGLPIGALVTTPKTASLLGPGDHATTFGGGPVVCASALAVLEVMEEDGLVERAASLGARLKGALEEAFLVAAGEVLPAASSEASVRVTEVRGKGLMLALQLDRPVARAVVERALAKGIILNDVRPDAIRLLPPLIMGEAEIERLVDGLKEAFSEV